MYSRLFKSTLSVSEYCNFFSVLGLLAFSCEPWEEAEIQRINMCNSVPGHLGKTRKANLSQKTNLSTDNSAGSILCLCIVLGSRKEVQAQRCIKFM